MTQRQQWQWLFSRWRRHSRSWYLVAFGGQRSQWDAHELRELTGVWDLPRPVPYYLDHKAKAYKPSRAFRRWLKEH